MMEFNNEFVIKEKFFNRQPDEVAKDLLGNLLVRRVETGEYLAGIIVETEAYLSSGDAAAHNSRGKTTANRSLFSKSGTAYVHSLRQWKLIDVVTESKEIPGSVLIRALEPLVNEEQMKENRGCPNKRELISNGPGKLSQALNIERKHDGIDLTDFNSDIFIYRYNENTYKIAQTTRIGITKSKELNLRFYIEENIFVSK